MTATAQEQLIGRVLRVGVWLSVVLLSAGLIFFAAEGVSEASSVSLKDFFPRVFGSGDSLSPGFKLLYAGLIVLVLTPLVRVVMTLVMFFREREWSFFTISLFVSGMLIVELVIALT
ncbi:MAG: DUF1634 domain-containing protein [Ignavibacteriales bacterium]|nr:DUF1634 domain-containing protein [Ignavibacteriales bacterium]